jgi:AsmA protein
VKALRISLLAFLGFVIITGVAGAIFVATFDANRYKPEIEKLVFDQTGRVLEIDGNISLTLFPNIGADINRATLSDKDPKQAFVTIESSRVSVALLPLLSGQVLIDGLYIDGLSATVVRDKSGLFNFADLLKNLSRQDESASPKSISSNSETKGQPSSFQVNIASIVIANTRVHYNDLKSNTDLKISGLNLKTGQISPRSSGKLELSANAESKSLALNVNIRTNSEYKINLSDQKINFNQLTTKVSGNWQDIKSIDAKTSLNLTADLTNASYSLSQIKSELKADVSGHAAEINFNLPKANITGSEVRLDPATLALSFKGPQREIKSDFKFPAFSLNNDQLNLQKIAANILITDPALGKSSLKITTNSDLSLNTQSKTLSIQSAGQFDGSSIKASLGVVNFSQPTVTFDLALDQLKLDRFDGAITPTSTTASRKVPVSASTSTPVSTPAAASAVNSLKSDQAIPPPQSGASPSPAVDLTGLKNLKLQSVKGKIYVGKLLSKGISLEQLNAEVAFSQGKLSVSPHSAQLFGGKTSGSFTVDANTNQFTLKENVTDIKLESLLTALGKDPKVTGKGALALDLTSAGNTIKTLEQNLAGLVSIKLHDGTIKGIDIGAIINKVRAMLGKAPTQAGAGSGQTTFTDLTASAVVKNGIVTNRDLNVKAPLFRLEGAGTINIAQSSLDYLTKVAVVESSSGQGGKDLAALRGITIPIKITGKLDKPQYIVDVASLAGELAKSELGDQAQREINKVVPGLGDALKGLFGR